MTLPAMRSSSPCATWIAHSVCSGPQTERERERERLPFPLPLLLQPGAGLPHFTWGLFLLFAVRSLAGFLIEHGHFAIPQTHNGVVRNWQSNGSDVTAAASAAAKRRRLYNIVLLSLFPASLPWFTYCSGQKSQTGGKVKFKRADADALWGSTLLK